MSIFFSFLQMFQLSLFWPETGLLPSSQRQIFLLFFQIHVCFHCLPIDAQRQIFAVFPDACMSLLSSHRQPKDISCCCLDHFALLLSSRRHTFVLSSQRQTLCSLPPKQICVVFRVTDLCVVSSRDRSFQCLSRDRPFCCVLQDIAKRHMLRLPSKRQIF